MDRDGWIVDERELVTAKLDEREKERELFTAKLGEREKEREKGKRSSKMSTEDLPWI